MALFLHHDARTPVHIYGLFGCANRHFSSFQFEKLSTTQAWYEDLDESSTLEPVVIRQLVVPSIQGSTLRQNRARSESENKEFGVLVVP